MKKYIKNLIFCCFALSLIVATMGYFDLIPDFGIISQIADFILPTSGGVLYAVTPGVDGPGTIPKDGLIVGEDGEEIFDNTLSKDIIKVRPSDTPLDTLTREINNVTKVEGFKAGGWEIGTRDTVDKVVSASTTGKVAVLKVGKFNMWQNNDVLIVSGKLGPDNKPLCLFVVNRAKDTDSISVVVINGTNTNVPALEAETKLLRLGSAANETDAQTVAWNALPVTRENYCQIHMAQVEMSTLFELRKKKVTYDWGTSKEQAVWEMKRKMELTNLFGVKGITYDMNNKPIYTSDGVWNQIPSLSTIGKSGATDAEYVGLTREIFDGNNGADRRLLLAGSGLIQSLSSVKNYARQLEAKNVEVVHGIRVNRIITNFGELLVKPLGSLFMGEYADCGIVLDMSYVRKFVFEPLESKDLDLDGSGQKRVKAQRLLENYCLYLENLPVHRKIQAV